MAIVMNTPIPTGEAYYGVVPMRIRVVLVDDHQLIRGGLRRAFDASNDFEVVGEAGLIAEAVNVLDRLKPDVLVTDVRLPDGDGIELTTRVRKDDPVMGI